MVSETLKNPAISAGGTEKYYSSILLNQRFLFTGSLLEGGKEYPPFISMIRNIRAGTVARQYCAGQVRIRAFAFLIDLPNVKSRWTKLIPIDQIILTKKEIHG